MPIQLYGNPLSTYCAKVRVVLRYKQVPFEDLPPPDGYGSDAYRAIVPMGTIPGFVADGLVLSESEAIAEYLEDVHPQPALLPAGAAARARVRSLSRIHDCWVEPQLRALYGQAAPAHRDDAVVARHIEGFHRRLGELARYAAPSPYLAGEELTLADCAWPTTLVQAELMFGALGHELRLPAELARWRDAVDEHPACAPGIAPCRDAMQGWLKQSGATN